MIHILQRFVSVRYPYTDALARQRANGIFLITLSLLVVLVFSWVLYITGLATSEIPAPASGIYLIGLPVMAVAICYFIQTGRLNTAIWLFLLALYVGALPYSILSERQHLPVLLFLPTVAAGVLLERRKFVFVLGGLLLTLLLLAAMGNQVFPAAVIDADNSNLLMSDFMIMAFVMGTCAAFLYLFGGTAQQLSDVSAEDIRHFRTISAFAEAGEENRLLASTLRLVQNELGYSVGQIFLINNDANVYRRVRLGMGQDDVTVSEVVNSGNVAVVQEVVNAKQPVTVTLQDVQPRPAHLAISAKRALVVPIADGTHIYGALDVQVASDTSFSTNQVEAFTLLGQRLGEAMSKVRLIADLQQAVREREEAATYMRAQLAEIQGRDRYMLSGGWSKYIRSRGELFGYNLQSSGGNIVPAADLPPDIQAALTRGEVYVEARGSEQVINAPIVLRGEVLGAMSFAVPAERVVSERELDMIRTVANRLGVALENNRLLEQTQAQAQRERKASEVANVLLTATSIESLMELAAENFNEALNAVYTRVYLEPGVVAEPPARGEPA